MSTPPPPKRQKTTSSTATTTTTTEAPAAESPLLPSSIPPRTPLDIVPPPAASTSSTSPTSPTLGRKRGRGSPKLNTLPPGTSLPSESATNVSISSLIETPEKKKGRTNTPWTAAEEQRLKQMRDAGNSWGEIAKAFPNRTEGSVKKHWYKDMHYAEFAEDESVALREAIKEYEANKWKAIGQKLGKPAKACEQYAREHFKNL